MAQFQVAAHRRASQIQISVFHSEVVATVCIVFYCKWRSERATQHRQFLSDNLYIACCYLVILTLTLAYNTFHANAIFASQFVSFITKTSIFSFVKYKLCNTITVAQINEGHTTHLT